MSSLVPCIRCRRHVQRGEPVCPFCGVARSTPVLGRQVLVPKGAKRATLFAIGVSLVSACEGDDSVTIPIYGAPAAPMSQGGAAGAGGNAGAGPMAGAGGDVGNPQPVYGAPAPPAQGGNAGTEANPPDAGGNSQPVYGAPVPSDAGDDPADAGDASPL